MNFSAVRECSVVFCIYYWGVKHKYDILHCTTTGNHHSWLLQHDNGATCAQSTDGGVTFAKPFEMFPDLSTKKLAAALFVGAAVWFRQRQ